MVVGEGEEGRKSIPRGDLVAGLQKGGFGRRGGGVTGGLRRGEREREGVVGWQRREGRGVAGLLMGKKLDGEQRSLRRGCHQLVDLMLPETGKMTVPEEGGEGRL